MPPLLILAFAGAVAYAGYRKMISDAEKMNARIKRRDQEAKSGSQGTLIRDPKTGVYTVAKD